MTTFKQSRITKAKSWELPVENVTGASWKTYVGVRKEPKGKDIVYAEDNEGKKHSFSIYDLANFFIQARGFPTILKLGNVYGEGQFGGREVTELAHEVENKFVEKYGMENYRERMGKAIKELGG
jgi:hypothetical protein